MKLSQDPARSFPAAIVNICASAQHHSKPADGWKNNPAGLN